MIIRLRVKGFKNLKEIDISFGAFTCIAGANAVGKSNLFDAIRFLSATANLTLTEAAFSIRDSQNEKRSINDIRNIFYHNGSGYCEKAEFEADMVIPKTAIDHLGQIANAKTTFVRYKLEIAYREQTDIAQSAISVISESLTPIPKREMHRALKNIGASSNWINSIQADRKASTPFISTNLESAKVEISQDGVAGRKKALSISSLPRTVLSTANAVETPTVLVTKKEMESWQLLQLEPSSLRSPDDLIFTETPKITTDGKHLPATLYRLISDKRIQGDVKTSVANRLNRLIDDVFRIEIEKDDKRDLLTLMIQGRKTPMMPARSLSDGTLRFLALAVIESDPEMQGVICMEEPENGIHPKRIKAILELLEDIAVDITQPGGDDNPLRQVIINTHSPVVVSETTEDSLLFAEQIKIPDKNKTEVNVTFRCLKGTWRGDKNTISKAKILNYLNPTSPEVDLVDDSSTKKTEELFARKRVIDRIGIQGKLAFTE
ncbi:MAG: AAA family ATPase [Chitinophagales bacterium]|nr:AAA family ATPase [Chitinophagales bacterium]